MNNAGLELEMGNYVVHEFRSAAACIHLEITVLIIHHPIVFPFSFSLLPVA